MDGYEEDMNGCLLLYTRSSRLHGICPYCQSVSRKVHNRYIRRLQDLPAFGKNVILCFQARKFFCHNKEYRYKTFAEQPGNEVFRYRRTTRRCEGSVYRQGLQLSSINSSCMLVNRGIRISKSTILRDLHRLRTPQCTEIRKIGVDDWAFRKVIAYGTIIIDLSRGIPVDLLGTRSKEDFSKWLSDHRDIWLVSRDRSTEYSHAIAASGLEVTEVAKSALGKELTDYEYEVTNALFGVEWFDQLLEAAGSFLKCLRSNKPVRLERWLDKHEKSILPRIRTFVRGIRMDIKAVKNAMIYPVSNGITEGFVNKLKTIKRVMYGKAKLPMLKIKMVITTWIFN